MIDRINLLPDSKQKGQQQKRLQRLISATVVSIIAVAVVVPGILLLVKGSQSLYLHRVQGQIDDRITQLKNTPDMTTMLTVKDHLNSLGSLYATRKHIGELLAFLPGVTPRKVTMDSLSVDNSGTLKIGGSAPSYADVQKFYKALQNSGVKVDPNKVEPDPDTTGDFTKVTLDSVSGPSGETVQFTISATFNPALIDGVKS